VSFKFEASMALIVVEARILGPAGDTISHLALDTGASSTVIGWDVLDMVGFKPADAIGHVEMTTGSATQLVPKIKLKQLAALGKRRRGLEIIAHSLPKGASVDGLLGLDFFRKSKLTIDFRKNVVQLD
jgi:predicted aspartyl protease